ncbi:hypothetical protein BB559_004847 [Furculomyces boomerangus]|uniref:Uncharacterized protein n=2 Tax=Harpellales TaxID=61421 RepID=A0A2T9YC82_9FUNG|nr:hypothetical protein BB559_004847 [Furculomyces boomerangus]PWA00875.1 hypothetical protein BB558_003059 [Smittium angustum]
MSSDKTQEKKPSFLESLQPREEWDTTDLKKATFWVLIFNSFLNGLLYGVFGLTGYPGFVTFLAVSYFVIGSYWKSYLGINISEFGGPMDFAGEGIGPSVSIFLVRQYQILLL